jgi:hypothetical protein
VTQDVLTGLRRLVARGIVTPLLLQVAIFLAERFREEVPQNEAKAKGVIDFIAWCKAQQ